MARDDLRAASDRNLDDLLACLREGTADGSVREEVLRRMTPLVQEVIAESFAHTGHSTEELFRSGYLGLLNAVCNFDLARGQSFRNYASNLVKGEIRQHIRDQAQQARIPQWMNDLNRQIENAEARLLRETGRLPTLPELADVVNITEDGIAEIFKAREALSYVSLDVEQRANDPAPSIDMTRIRSKREVPFPIEQRIRIASALARLADLQQYLFRRLFDAE